MLLTSCISSPKEEELQVSFPYFPDPILDDGIRVYKVPNYKAAMSTIYKEDKYVIVPEDIWNQYCVWEDQIIIPPWYWLDLATFSIDYEASLERLNIWRERIE